MTICIDCKCVRIHDGEHTVELCHRHALANEAFEMLRLQEKRANENMIFARIELKNLQDLIAKFADKKELDNGN